MHVTSDKKIGKWLFGLQSEDPVQRREAAKRLGRRGNREAVRPLCEALKDESWRVRSCAAQSLGVIGDPWAAEPLIEALDDKLTTVRREAAKALGHIHDNHAIEALCKALGDKKASVRENAMFALEQIGVGTVPMLCQRLADENIRLRVHATLTLSQLYRDNRHETLDRILGDRHLTPQQRWQGLEAIRASRPSRLTFHWLGDVYRYCQEAVQFSKAYGREDSAACRGARQVLEYMTLARPAMRDLASERTQLLRAVQNDIHDDSGETLLRGSSVEERDAPMRNKPSIFRLIHWFATLLRRPR
jgi:hypothetical protein